MLMARAMVVLKRRHSVLMTMLAVRTVGLMNCSRRIRLMVDGTIVHGTIYGFVGIRRCNHQYHSSNNSSDVDAHDLQCRE